MAATGFPAREVRCRPPREWSPASSPPVCLRRELGVGIDFYGRVWSGGAGTTTGGAALPRQSWTTAPGMTYKAYHEIMASYYQPQRHAWDAAAQAAYLSINQTGSADDKFISYDDPATCRAKVQYATRRGLGGVMIYELGGGYRPDQTDGLRDPLLQAVKQAVRDTFVISEFQPAGEDIRSPSAAPSARLTCWSGAPISDRFVGHRHPGDRHRPLHASHRSRWRGSTSAFLPGCGSTAPSRLDRRCETNLTSRKGLPMVSPTSESPPQRLLPEESQSHPDIGMGNPVHRGHRRI